MSASKDSLSLSSTHFLYSVISELSVGYFWIIAYARSTESPRILISIRANVSVTVQFFVIKKKNFVIMNKNQQLLSNIGAKM